MFYYWVHYGSFVCPVLGCFWRAFFALFKKTCARNNTCKFCRAWGLPCTQNENPVSWEERSWQRVLPQTKPDIDPLIPGSRRLILLSWCKSTTTVTQRELLALIWHESFFSQGFKMRQLKSECLLAKRSRPTSNKHSSSPLIGHRIPVRSILHRNFIKKVYRKK